MSNQTLIDATIQSLRSIRNPRLFHTERGYQGEFFCALQNILKEQGIVDGTRILEMEYQKSQRHGIRQRPDIILHVPAEISGAGVMKNNFAVWALKYRSSIDDAIDDFGKLNDMFAVLEYPLGFFINIDSMTLHFDKYAGDFADRLVIFAVQLDGADVSIKMAHWNNGAIVEIDL
jgi:hypothetical protein